MKIQKRKSLEGVTVKFELLNDRFKPVEVLAEKSFPDARFNWYSSMDNHLEIDYICKDKDVKDYVLEVHQEFAKKYDYDDYDKAPLIRQAFYNKKGQLIYFVDEIDYDIELYKDR